MVDPIPVANDTKFEQGVFILGNWQYYVHVDL